jgi:hypothetical protein
LMTGLEGICAIAGVHLNDNGIPEVTPKPFRDAQRDPHHRGRRRNVRRAAERSPAAELSAWIRRSGDGSTRDNVFGNDRCQGDHIRRRRLAASNDNACAFARRDRQRGQQECSGDQAKTVPHNCRKSITGKTGKFDLRARCFWLVCVELSLMWSTKLPHGTVTNLSNRPRIAA